jgi:hypothetical protein
MTQVGEQETVSHASGSLLPILATLISELVVVVVLFIYGRGWWSIVLVVPLIVVTMLMAKSRRVPVQPPHFSDVPAQPLPPPEPQSTVVADVRLPSRQDDYYFLFSATMSWLPGPEKEPGVPAHAAALAVESILSRARLITRQREPGDASMIRHELGSELGRLLPDPARRVQAMASEVQLAIPEEDRERLDRLAGVRKDEVVWQHERKYEQSKREYLSQDVLKDTGSAVVWWLTRNGDQIEKVVSDIDKLAQLSAAANNNMAVEEAAASGLTASFGPEPAYAGANGHDRFSQSASSNDSKSAGDCAAEFLDATYPDQNDPGRLLLAKRLAEMTRAHGRTDIADALYQRFDLSEDPTSPLEPEDGD